MCVNNYQFFQPKQMQYRVFMIVIYESISKYDEMAFSILSMFVRLIRSKKFF